MCILKILVWFSLACMAWSSHYLPELYKKSSDHVRLVYEFPLGTDIENIAVRSTGQLLVTTATAGDLYLLNPIQNGPPVLVNQFNASSLAGIAEYQKDVFAVLVGVTEGPLKYTWSVYGVNLRGAEIGPDNTLSPSPIVTKIATIPQAPFLNGMSLLSSQHGLIYLGDAITGIIWLLNVNTGAYSVAINNTLTAPAAAPVVGKAGTNGIHVHGGFLYLTNTGQSIFAKIPITQEGTPINGGSVIAHAYNTSVVFDDFALNCVGDSFLVTGPANSIEYVSADGLTNKIVAGSLNATAIAEPTSAAFGRTSSDSNILYVTTAGGLFFPVDGTIRIGGQVVAVTTATTGCFSLNPYIYA